MMGKKSSAKNIIYNFSKTKIQISVSNNIKFIYFLKFNYIYHIIVLYFRNKDKKISFTLWTLVIYIASRS